MKDVPFLLHSAKCFVFHTILLLQNFDSSASLFYCNLVELLHSLRRTELQKLICSGNPLHLGSHSVKAQVFRHS